MTISAIALASDLEPNVNIVLNSWGTICTDDPKTFFWCSQQGLPQKTEDEVDIEVGASNFELIGSEYPEGEESFSATVMPQQEFLQQ